MAELGGKFSKKIILLVCVHGGKFCIITETVFLLFLAVAWWFSGGNPISSSRKTAGAEFKIGKIMIGDSA